MALEKLSIQAYSDPKFSSTVGKPFKVMINPDKYSRTFAIDYNDQQGMGTTGGGPAYHKSLPETIKFEIVFDSSGAVPVPGGGSPKPVVDWIDEFKDVTFEYNGDIHSSNYLWISWGALSFKCRLQQFTVNYTVFKEDGTPIRAKVNAEFKEFIDAETAATEGGRNSPDLSHIHTVVAGDRLPLLCHKIYNDSSLYLEVARYNNLTHFRNLLPGTHLKFPPVKK